MATKKTYKISTSVNEDILEVVVTGDITKPDTHEKMMNEIIDAEKSSNVKKQLVDIRKLKGRLGTLEVYSLVRNYPAERPKMRVALVDTPKHVKTASFHETTAYNAGLPFKWFTDIDTARAWLKSK